MRHALKSIITNAKYAHESNTETKRRMKIVKTRMT